MPQPSQTPLAPTNLIRFADMADVHEHVATALERAGLNTAFPIQAAVVPVAARGRDVLVRAPTGSGKTMAFGLPIIARLARGGTRPTAVILVPSRELAMQVRNDLTPIAWSKQIRCVAVYGGGSSAKQARQAALAPIVVATPGRLVDLVRQGIVNLSHVGILVLDEADRMLDMGFLPQVEELAQAMPRRQQTMLFSATLDGRIGKVAAKYTADAVTINNDDAPGAGGAINHVLVATGLAAKVDAVVGALQDAARDLAVVFVRTQLGAENLKESLRTHGVRATAIHGGMGQPERLREYRRFQDGTCDVLVATDVFARGMDLDRITHVINFELPDDADAYRHRTGRTGRAGRTGTAITLVAPTQRKVVEALLDELGLPARLLKNMRPAPTERARVVPVEERYSDPTDHDVRRAPSKGAAPHRYARAGGSFAGQPKPSFATSGNGQGRGPKHGTGTGTSRGTSRTDRSTAHDRPGPTGTNGRGRGGAGAGPGKGVVTAYDAEKGFGFIRQTMGGKDVFFHRSSLAGINDRHLAAGQAVSFGLDASDGKKLRARTVTLA